MFEIFLKVCVVVSFAFMLAILLALPLMWLWNFLTPDLFGLKEIGIWKSFCLMLLSSFLFKGGGSSSSKD